MSLKFMPLFREITLRKNAKDYSSSGHAVSDVSNKHVSTRAIFRPNTSSYEDANELALSVSRAGISFLCEVFAISNSPSSSPERATNGLCH